MVNGQGHAAIGFSGSNASQFVASYFTGRLASDVPGTMGTVELIKAGEAAYTLTDGIGRNRWGDYSYTSLDPDDDMTFRTIQEYADTPTFFSSSWGTVVAQLLSPAPTLSDPAASGNPGAAGVVINLAGWTVHTSLMPIFARDVLGTDSAGLGWLLFAFGIGAITGSAILTAFRNLRGIGKLLIGAVIMWHASILAFSASESFYLSMTILFAMGIWFSATQVFMLTVLLRTTKPEFRGRIIGLRVLAIYAFSFGSVAAGSMAELWGAPQAANIVGLLGIGLVLALVAFTPKLRQA